MERRTVSVYLTDHDQNSEVDVLKTKQDLKEISERKHDGDLTPRRNYISGSKDD